MNVNISPRGEHTSIQMVGNRDGAGALTFVFPMMASAILIGAVGAALEPTSAVGIVSLVTGLLGSGFLTARTIWSRSTKKFRTRMTKLMEVVSRTVEETTVPLSPEEGAALEDAGAEPGALPPGGDPGGETAGGAMPG